MKCAQIYPYFNHPTAHTLAKELVKKGCDITIYCCSSKGNFHESKNIKIIEIPSLLKLAGYIPLSFPIKMDLYEHDLINIHEDFYLNSLYGMISAKFFHKIPIVLTEHYYLHKGKHILWDYFLKGLHFSIGRPVINNSDIYIALSNESKKYLISRNVDEKKVYVIGHPVDISFFKPHKTYSYSFNKVKNIPNKNIKILFVGRLIKLKGIYDLITSFSLLKKTFKDVTLIFAGSGPEMSGLSLYAKQLGVHSSVIFLGQVPRTQLPFFYNSSDIFVLSSHIEIFSSALLEAIACGMPVIGTSVGGTLDIIVDGYNGYIVPPKNPILLYQKLLELCIDPDKREKYGKRSRKRAITEFSCENIVSKTLIVFDKVL